MTVIVREGEKERGVSSEEERKMLVWYYFAVLQLCYRLIVTVLWVKATVIKNILVFGKLYL